MSNYGVVLLNNSSLTVPLVPGVVQNSPNIVKTGMALAQRCPAPLIYSTTGYYVGTCTHTTGIRLASLTSVRQRAITLECAFVVLNGLSMHCHTYQKYSKSLQCKGTSLLQMAPMVSTLQTFHCSHLKYGLEDTSQSSLQLNQSRVFCMLNLTLNWPGSVFCQSCSQTLLVPSDIGWWAWSQQQLINCQLTGCNAVFKRIWTQLEHGTKIGGMRPENMHFLNFTCIMSQ